MATVTANLATISNVEAADGFTTANIPSGGGGATANTEIYLQGAQSLGRRQTTTGTTPAGFALIDNADNDCSASGTHIGIWFWITQYAILNVATVTVGSGTTPASVYNGYDIPLSEYPNLGGWVRVWIDPTKVRSRGAGTINTSAIRHYGALLAFSTSPGGNAQNLILDSAHYVSGPALTLTGTTGLWSDFTVADENVNNQYGVMRNSGGVFNLFARVRLGSSATSLVMDESSFTIIFPQQTWVSSTWMGVDVNLENASTVINWSSGSLSSVGNTNKGDLVVTGVLGTFDVINTSFSNMRALSLSSGVNFDGCLISNSGLITTNGAFLDSCTILNSTDSVAMNVGSLVSRVTNTEFTSSGTGHAMEITTAGNYTLNGLTFNGYAAPQFSEPNAGDADYNSVSILLHMDGTNGSTTFTDNSPTPKTLTVTGNTQISTSKSKFGGASALFDGTGDYLSNTNADFSFGTGDFTVEGWVNFAVLKNCGIFQIGATLFPGVTGIGFGLSNTTFRWLLYYNGTQITASTGPVINQWYHFAVCRSSGVTRVFIDGTALNIAPNDPANYTGQVLGIGSIFNTNFVLNGNLDEFRITKGVARYTSNFTAPTIPFSNQLEPSSGTRAIDVGTNASIYVSASTGAVILTVSGGGSTPSIRTAGATVDVISGSLLTLTGLIADSEVRAYLGSSDNPAAATELAGTESSGTSFSFSQSAGGADGYIQIFHVEYQPIFLPLTYSSSDQTIPIQQIADRQYARGTTFVPG